MPACIYPVHVEQCTQAEKALVVDVPVMILDNNYVWLVLDL